MAEFIKFEVVAGDGYWLVRKASRALTMSDVPAEFMFEFEKKSMAVEQVRRLEKLQRHYGQAVKLRLRWTDDVFEQVADKLHPAWD